MASKQYVRMRGGQQSWSSMLTMPGEGECRTPAAAAWPLLSCVPEPGAATQAGSGQQPGQLGALERLARRKGKMQAAAQRSHAPDVAPLMMRSYLDRRAKRLLYADKDLHVLVGACCRSACLHPLCMMPP